MSWDVLIYFQERGTKKETSQAVSFRTRDEAVAALEKLEADIAEAGVDNTVVMDSGRHRVSFLKQDYRRTWLYEAPDGPIVVSDPWTSGW